MSQAFTIGLDFGTNSARGVVVNVANGDVVETAVFDYPTGDAGVVYDALNPHVARQNPADYLLAVETIVRSMMSELHRSVSPDEIIGIGVDTTGSTPMPVDAHGQALNSTEGFEGNIDAMAWLWKDHTSHEEAEEITASASETHPYLTTCGGRYSSEWFWAKLLKLARINPEVSAATKSWVEIADWIPGVLSGNAAPDRIRRGVCGAGHKAMYSEDWGGYPDRDWLASLHPELARIRDSLGNEAHDLSSSAGTLCLEWAERLGLPAGIPIAIGAFDAHLGAIGASIQDGTLVKIIGTSTCDIMVSSKRGSTPFIPGLCGIVPGSVLPGKIGLEAGQSAVGDIYNWFVNVVGDGSPNYSHDDLTRRASSLLPGESGLLTLDWHNGNRTVLVDQRLSGMTLGLSLHTQPAEMYRSLLEASAFGARVIVERLEEFGVPVQRVVNCGGISARNPLAMQIYADVLNREVQVSASLQTCALGSAIAAAVAAGAQRGGHEDFDAAVTAMGDKGGRVYRPNADSAAIYQTLFELYRQLHDGFGVPGYQQDVSGAMKALMSLRDDVRQSRSAA